MTDTVLKFRFTKIYIFLINTFRTNIEPEAGPGMAEIVYIKCKTSANGVFSDASHRLH